MKQDKEKELKKLEYKITPEGSLGLIALGDVGLRAWRKVKQQIKNAKK